MDSDDLIEDLEFVKHAQQTDTVIRYLAHKDELNFSVGDYLVKETKWSGKWSVEAISNVSNIPKRFICVHEDEYGVKYVRALSAMGERLPYICAVTNLVERERYVVDPDYADHLILGGGEKFDFASQKKKERSHRNKISKLNKALAVVFASNTEGWSYLSGLQLNSTFYMGWSKVDAVSSKHEILEITPTTIVVKDFKRDYQWAMNMRDIEGRVFFFQEPYSYETI